MVSRKSKRNTDRKFFHAPQNGTLIAWRSAKRGRLFSEVRTHADAREVRHFSGGRRNRLRAAEANSMPMKILKESS